jgi:hypothetical protein
MQTAILTTSSASIVLTGEEYRRAVELTPAHNAKSVSSNLPECKSEVFRLYDAGILSIAVSCDGRLIDHYQRIAS